MNYLQLELGGERRGLKFNIGTLKSLQEQYGVDPFDFKAEGSAFNELYPFAEKIVHAALLANCISKKIEPDFTKEQVQEWMNELTIADINLVATYYNGIFTSTKAASNGEVGKNTQPVNLG